MGDAFPLAQFCKGNLSCQEMVSLQQINAITGVRESLQSSDYEGVIVMIGVSVRAPNRGNRGNRIA
jgi:hypothetical protein